MAHCYQILNVVSITAAGLSRPERHVTDPAGSLDQFLRVLGAGTAEPIRSSFVEKSKEFLDIKLRSSNNVHSDGPPQFITSSGSPCSAPKLHTHPPGGVV